MKRLLLAATLSLLSLPTFAATGAARERLNAFSTGLHALTGRFSQTLANANGDQGKVSSGTLALQAPRQFRWETTAPYKQTIVADGSRVWLYDPDLEQVTVRRQSSEEAQSPLTVLTDLSQMDKDFKSPNRASMTAWSGCACSPPARTRSSTMPTWGSTRVGWHGWRSRTSWGIPRRSRLPGGRRMPPFPRARSSSCRRRAPT